MLVILFEYIVQTCHLCFIPEGVAKTSQIFLRDFYIYQNDLAMRNTADVRGGTLIAI
jgi:hypothetical protein